MSLAVKGRITAILVAEDGMSKADKPWKKQSFVIDTGAQYNPEVAFQVFGEAKIEELITPLAVDQEVEVSFNLSSREFNGKYYHNVDAWKINQVGGTATTKAAPAPAIDDAPVGDDDLPF